MRSLLNITFGAFCGLFGAGILLLVTSKHRGEPITLEPPPTPAPIVVHVTGAVNDPGVISLSQGSRIQDAITAAGGFTDHADIQNLNLAAYLEDGKYIQVPAIATITATIENPPLPTWGVRSFVIDSKININTASQQELESLPFIGSEYALRIIAYRNANGPFETIEAIQEVYGIGPKTFENIKDLITVENPP